MWQPELESGRQPLYERLVVAMARDIRTGELPPGSRLPPQRDLAFRLGVSVGSVTRAYAEAERRGLLSAHVGRGSFVRGRLSSAPDIPTPVRHDGAESALQAPIDLRRNTPPPVPLMDDLRTALATLMARDALEPAVHYIPGAGLPQVRAAGARWLAAQYGLDVDPDALIQCNGGQHGIALVFSSLCAPGSTILCESSTFYGARAAAEHFGLTLHGLPMDEEGILPEAVARAAVETGSRLLFTLPTLHNPTTRTMSDRRRQAIADVARAQDLLILEDDAYYAYSGRPRQIASYAPERTLYLASLSKGVCAGFRLAFLTVPPTVPHERLLRGVRALGYCPPALGALVFNEWVADGRIDAIAQSVQSEAAARWALARATLGDLIAPCGADHSPHAWMPMGALDAERVTGRLLRAGVEITPPDASVVSGDADTGLRVCLGATHSRSELSRALTIIADVVRGGLSDSRDGIL
ncbi:GntR family transcriptional regulator [Ameyamaea chiangmaiensis NBRC 103196]|uniref:PLP-dependent aminotransferase family protein n=1 Tax=Ameyamaea chiangmaiensis TaxID=442969 RepID=A0A850PAC6_9PROT|nr:PLP-dependent aminotransferase family protein [Ameyamaea chiangmaiensis]MBS4076135.1 PLP-dependent aminotransferase family protein [Ameyamaea chiangmaiensis]NVN39649.1 PLP-dependent aminotransferase family protein [Ameyamaea chiangmaiensis]GBQ67151.1 GntR family transcriptional regulator [Ameyamaea chiangmaiensis NBRC 103196]